MIEIPRDAARHPNEIDLDRLRAGLLDGDTASALHAHLEQCPACREKIALWGVVKQVGDGSGDRIACELRARRREALSVARRRMHPRLALFALAAALLMAVALFIGMPQYRPATPSAALPQETDVYANVDFYLWLAKQSSSRNEHDPS